MNRFFTPASLLSALLLLSACGTPAANPPAVNPSATPSTASVDFTVKFKGMVNGQPFRCGQEYTGIGTTGSKIRSRDFRFYVSAPRLVAADGTETPITLTADNKWQTQNVTLIDFEDGTGGCEGNADTNAEIKGTIPAGTLKPGMSLRYELGLPFALNHADASRAASPLNLTSMFWIWRFGYKFARLDMATTGQPQGYYIHIGSTGCTGDMAIKHEGHDHAAPTSSPAASASPAADHGALDPSLSKPPASCSEPNLSTITLTNFDAEKQHVEADLGRLLSENNVDVNQADTPGGCMSGLDDSDCKGIFKQLGLGSDKNFQGFFALKAN